MCPLSQGTLTMPNPKLQPFQSPFSYPSVLCLPPGSLGQHPAHISRTPCAPAALYLHLYLFTLTTYQTSLCPSHVTCSFSSTSSTPQPSSLKEPHAGALSASWLLRPGQGHQQPLVSDLILLSSGHMGPFSCSEDSVQPPGHDSQVSTLWSQNLASSHDLPCPASGPELLTPSFSSSGPCWSSPPCSWQ